MFVDYLKHLPEDSADRVHASGLLNLSIEIFCYQTRSLCSQTREIS